MAVETHALRAASAAATALQAAVMYLNNENASAAATARLFLDEPPSAWPKVAREYRHRMGFGALDYLLDIARLDLDRDGRRAYALTAIVVRCARSLTVPRHAALLVPLVRGRAWKEHGNALYVLGRYQCAYAAGRRSAAIFSRQPALSVERAGALALQGKTAHQLRRTVEATALLREAKATFVRFGEEGRALQVAILEASLLYDAGELVAARSAFLIARATAERLGDERELARILNNLGQVAARLQEYDAALRYLSAAQELFERLDMSAERQRVFWIHAHILRDTGEFLTAMTELLRVRHELTQRGMAIDSALVGLDLIEMLAAIEEHADARRLAGELVETFSAAGMHRNARIALAYLAEQARLEAPALALQEDLRRVRTYLHGLRTTPDAEFVPPAPH